MKAFPFSLLIAAPLTAGIAAPSPPAGLQLDLSAPDVVVARTTSQAVTVAELRERVTADPIAARGSFERQLHSRLEALVLDRELERRFIARGGLEDPEYRSWSVLLERDLAARELDRALAREAKAAVAAVVPEEVPSVPARWRLRNLFIARPADAGPEEVERRRELIDALHQRLTQGEDFGSLARTHSESQTRIRDGRLGFVTLDRLEPTVAAAVRDLDQGALSPVIETTDGWTILLAEGVVPAGPRPRAADQQRETALQEHLEALRQQAEKSAREALAPTGTPINSNDPPAVIVRFADGTTITAQDLDFFRRHRGLDAPADATEHTALVETAISSVAKAAAARDRGLLDAPAFRTSLERKLAALRADLELRRLAAAAVEPPTVAEIDQLYATSLESLRRPARFHLRSVQLPLDSLVLKRDQLERFSEVAATAAAGRSTLEGVVEAVPQAELIDHGWLTPNQIFRLGKAIDLRFAPKGADTSDSTRPGVVFGPVQEGRRLWVVEILGREPSRAPTRAEAELPLIQAAWQNARRNAEAKVRRQLLDELQLTVEEPILARLASRLAARSAPRVEQAAPEPPTGETR